MNRIEFQTYIDHDTIVLPQEYRNHIKGHARVIVIIEDMDEDEDMVEFLLDHPYEVGPFTPLTRDEIYERCTVNPFK